MLKVDNLILGLGLGLGFKLGFEVLKSFTIMRLLKQTEMPKLQSTRKQTLRIFSTCLSFELHVVA